MSTPEERAVAHAASLAIDAGIAYCAGCSEKITEVADDTIASLCEGCGELEIWHEPCLTEEARKDFERDRKHNASRWN